MISYLEDKLYSEAFNDGFEYAIEKLFAEEDDEKKPKKWPYAVGGAIAGTVGGAATTGAVGVHLFRKDVPKEIRKDFDSMSSKEFENFLNWYKKYSPSDYNKKINKAIGAGLGAAGALGVAAPMALYYHRKNKLNKKERD